MRCLALAQFWIQDGGQAHFILGQRLPETLERRIVAEGVQLMPLPDRGGGTEAIASTLVAMGTSGDAWVVLDGYHFSEGHQETLKEEGFHVLALDDCGHLRHYHADIVLNQNISAELSMYPDRESYTRLLLGTDFALLRKEFWKWRAWRRDTSSIARRLLITLGGSDKEQVNEQILLGLAHVRTPLQVKIIIGAHHKVSARLRSLASTLSDPAEFVLAPEDMSALLAWADMAVSGGGSTCWELAFMGLPSVVITLAQNQRGIGAALQHAGAALDGGWYENLDPRNVAGQIDSLAGSETKRSRMTAIGRGLVDSYGGKRVVEAMSGRRFLYLRDPEESDSRQVWKWANDPDTRAASFSGEMIPWHAHAAWFLQKLSDPQHRFLMIMDDTLRLVGHMRYQVEDRHATVSINLAPDQRGKGYGVRSLRQGTERLFRESGIDMIHAYIKSENRPSLAAFHKAGYKHLETTQVRGNLAEHLVIRKDECISGPNSGYVQVVKPEEKKGNP